MRIVITGGTGLIGSHLRRGLGDHEWVLLTRDPARAPAGVEAVAWQPLDGPPPPQALAWGGCRDPPGGRADCSRPLECGTPGAY